VLRKKIKVYEAREKQMKGEYEEKFKR